MDCNKIYWVLISCLKHCLKASQPSFLVYSLKPRWSRSFITPINSRWLKCPSSSSSNIWNTVSTTWWLRSVPVQIRTALLNSSWEIGRSAKVYMRMATLKSSKLLRNWQNARNSRKVIPCSSLIRSTKRSKYSSYLQFYKKTKSNICF